MDVNRSVVTLARGIAVGAHAGQVDKAGFPYIEHPMRVSMSVGNYLVEDENEYAAQALAWLHDVLEDTAVTVRDLLTAGLPGNFIYPLQALTHKKGEPREDYYQRILVHPLAVAVKLADVNDNWREDRLSYLPPEDQLRLAKKYTRAWEVLSAAR